MTYWSRFQTFEPTIISPVNSDVKMIVVIPCYNEEEPEKSVMSIIDNIPTLSKIEIIVVINAPENSQEDIILKNKNAEIKISNLEYKQNPSINGVFIINKILPVKDSGVGLARKIGMDEALFRFEQAGNINSGVIVCFDADSECDSNYLMEIEKNLYCTNNIAASIYFEHPLSGPFDKNIYEGIKIYELFLRYYINGLRYAGYPFAFHTIGSSMAVKAETYMKQGGMNKRKAGEDFYFLHKIIPLGNFTEINTTRVIPSPRPSDRVPFGTGRAINSWLINNEILFYNFNTFRLIKILIRSLPLIKSEESSLSEFYQSIDLPVKNFLDIHHFDAVVSEIRKNCSDDRNFKNRIIKWFDGFRMLKLTHFLTEKYFPKVEYKIALKELISEISSNETEDIPEAYLNILRSADRNFILKINLHPETNL
ncbi:MAG: hypothetical protein ACK40G_02065 [Cytophagaceae bacterium]